ncbi:hypothetical protein TIFTF001_007728 [Ficus carica]|uniref:Uncharacterized protein n=1 Tax=Ficus carica TaxID=3494 RepID=A0AA88ADV9_FICCA|nr:hypothetical protein TIFTF001_007728 [Ficus carica]
MRYSHCCGSASVTPAQTAAQARAQPSCQPQLVSPCAPAQARDSISRPFQARANLGPNPQPSLRDFRALNPASLILSPSWFPTSNRLIYQPGWRICCTENPLACWIHGYILRAP